MASGLSVSGGFFFMEVSGVKTWWISDFPLLSYSDNRKGIQAYLPNDRFTQVSRSEKQSFKPCHVEVSILIIKEKNWQE